MKKLSPTEARNRFWSRVAKTTPEECWLWLGCKAGGGYGTMKLHGKMTGTHRIAWIFTYGGIPPGKMVLHKCDNPPCCNPGHLFLGTNSDNMIDAITKGRMKPQIAFFGESNFNSKLTVKNVEAIKRMIHEGVKSLRSIGRQFGVSHFVIRQIRDKKTWVQVP